MRWKSDREDEFFYLKLVLALAVVVGVIAGLIEWNARRQAAAFTRELLRPATPEELRQIEQMFPIEASGGQVEKRPKPPKPATAPHSTPLGYPPTQAEIAKAPVHQPSRRDDPMFMHERCIDGRWYRKEGREWKAIGKCY